MRTKLNLSAIRARIRFLTSVIATIAVATTSASLLSGCSKEEFRKEQYLHSESEPGYRFLPAKVDILFVADDSASINSAFSAVQRTLTPFVNGLQNKAWDFHLGRTLISTPTDIRQVLVHPEYNRPFLKDGTAIPTTGIVPSDRAVTDPNQFSILGTPMLSGSNDYTYSNLFTTLRNASTDTYTHFLRQDALLAIIVLTNGTDYTVDPDHDGVVDNRSLLQTYANQLLSVKRSSQLIRFYPVASYAYYYGNRFCLTPGGTAYHGGSYFAMNDYIAGLAQFSTSGAEQLNFCNPNSLQTVLAAIDANLNVIRQSYVYTNIVLDEEPIPSSLHVSKNDTELPESTTDGWEYLGFQTVYTITAVYDEKSGLVTPLNPGLNQRTGYVIRLNGSAALRGSDHPSVVYEKL